MLAVQVELVNDNDAEALTLYFVLHRLELVNDAEALTLYFVLYRLELVNDAGALTLYFILCRWSLLTTPRRLPAPRSAIRCATRSQLSQSSPRGWQR